MLGVCRQTIALEQRLCCCPVYCQAARRECLAQTLSVAASAATVGVAAAAAAAAAHRPRNHGKVWVTSSTLPKRGFLHAKFWSATIPLSVRELAEAFLGTQCARIPGTCGTARASCCDGKVLLQLIWKAWVDCTGGQTNPVVRSSAMLSTKQAYKHVKHPTLKLFGSR